MLRNIEMKNIEINSKSCVIMKKIEIIYFSFDRAIKPNLQNDTIKNNKNCSKKVPTILIAD